ncbi:4Fe-4S binding protein [Streptosporangium sandarakinum]|uniref:Formate hydrogenlyase subunit 6/NADH:ubiquinone oxidoreductase subunit I n=1 Tax=Streptosporangium sandarakinum TaxID=1260955 RepID=A0A852UZB5_9ACTN|nr:4Fe-4S binding protein [Streptosporangium sandarakinum]NYF40483.1 formate hydrogenlyase subunit 6/NADH:ubiquinone oxidoreductase subunit I [Streptosporangium sandarakinum]
MLNKSVTQQYPDVRPDLPARSRGVIALVEENCTVCMLCARECPDWCIYIDSHKETLPAPEGGRPRARNVLDRFAIDFSLCMYCGICIEVCPFDALFWSPEFEYADGDIRNLLHEKDRLAAWVQTVPPPPAHEPNAEPPKELAAASRPARPRTTAGPARTVPGGAGTAGTPSAPSEAPASPTPPEATTSTGPSTSPESSTSSGPSTSSEPRRPERRTSTRRADVRAIRPPGALPKNDIPPAGDEPVESPGGRPEDSTPVGSEPAGSPPPGPGSGPAGSGSAGSSLPGAGPAGSGSAGSPPVGSEHGDQPPSPTESSRPERPRRRTSTRFSDVRAIRPPGALPKKDTPPAENLSTEQGGVPPDEGPAEQTSATDQAEESEEEK